MIVVPTADELNSARRDFEKDWGGVDEVLYGICRQYPDHSDRRGLTAKVALIDRAYSAGLERRVTPPPGKQAITVIADCFERHGARLDDMFAPLRGVDEPLSMRDMVTVVQVHGRFTQFLVKEVTTDGKSPRSFASKYLHFHNRAVLIYDSYAAAGLTKRVRWDGACVPFDCPEGADEEYWAFCVRFWRLYDACRGDGLDARVKTLDEWLFGVPE